MKAKKLVSVIVAVTTATYCKKKNSERKWWVKTIIIRFFFSHNLSFFALTLYSFANWDHFLALFGFLNQPLVTIPYLQHVHSRNKIQFPCITVLDFFLSSFFLFLLSFSMSFSFRSHCHDLMLCFLFAKQEAKLVGSHKMIYHNLNQTILQNMTCWTDSYPSIYFLFLLLFSCFWLFFFSKRNICVSLFVSSAFWVFQLSDSHRTIPF